MKKNKLEIVKKEGKAFDCVCTIKKDAYSMPSKFYAATVFYPKTKEESQTFYTQIVADIFNGKNKVEHIRKSDEFDSAREAKKWIEEIFLDFKTKAEQ